MVPPRWPRWPQTSPRQSLGRRDWPWPYERLRRGAPWCRHGPTGPSTATTAPPSPARLSSVAGLADAGAPLSCRPCLPVVRGIPHSRGPSLHRHSPASWLLRPPPPPSQLRSISRGSRFYDRPGAAVFTGGGGGLLQVLGVSLSPCRRSHPASLGRRVSQAATAQAAVAFPGAGSASGAAHVRGHLGVRLRYRLETRPPPTNEAVERLQTVGFPSPCSPSYRALAFPLGGFSPPAHASLSWTHPRTGHLRLLRLSRSHAEEGKGFRSHTEPVPPPCREACFPAPWGCQAPWRRLSRSPDSSGSSVPLGLAPRRPSRSSSTPHVRA